MSRLARRLARATFRPVSEREAREIERDHGIGGGDFDAEGNYVPPSAGFCDTCEAYVDETAGKLHRATCKVTAARRKAS